MKTGGIDVGGGLRGIYSVGIFDYCMDHQSYRTFGTDFKGEAAIPLKNTIFSPYLFIVRSFGQ